MVIVGDVGSGAEPRQLAVSRGCEYIDAVTLYRLPDTVSRSTASAQFLERW